MIIAIERPHLSLLSVLAATLLTVGSGFGQNLVVNGSFESPPDTNGTRVAYFDAAEMFPWQTTAPIFEVWTNGWTNEKTGVGPVYSADGGQNLEILSTTNQATVWQTVPTVPGTSYVFSFFHTPRPGASSILTVSVDSNIVAIFYESGVGLTNFTWQQFATNIVAAGNFTTLSFSDLSLNYGAAGTHIDGVVLEQNLVINGSFETPVDSNGTRVSNAPPAALYPWQTTADVFEIWTNGWSNKRTGVGPVYSADGGQNLEILSDTNQATVWQAVPTVPGASYTFSFFHTPRPGTESICTVSVGANIVATLDEQGVGLTDFEWRWFTTNFVATSNLTTLSFADISLNHLAIGTHIDGVVLEGAPSEDAGQLVQNPLVEGNRPVLQTPPLTLSMQMMPDSTVQCYWPTTPNHTYQVQYCDQLESANWQNLGGPLLSTGTALFIEDDPSPEVAQRYYRVVILQ
jgi:hypothetical protein